VPRAFVSRLHRVEAAVAAGRLHVPVTLRGG
jgi:hypothetical protein